MSMICGSVESTPIDGNHHWRKNEMNGRLTRQIETWMDVALEKLSGQDQFVYELQFQPEPKPNVIVVMFLPGMILGTGIQNVIVIQDCLRVTESEIEDMVQTMIEALRQARSQQAQGVKASSNGGGGEVTADIVDE